MIGIWSSYKLCRGILQLNPPYSGQLQPTWIGVDANFMLVLSISESNISHAHTKQWKHMNDVKKIYLKGESLFSMSDNEGGKPLIQCNY